jgi:hypothetical protein
MSTVALLTFCDANFASVLVLVSIGFAASHIPGNRIQSKLWLEQVF